MWYSSMIYVIVEFRVILKLLAGGQASEGQPRNLWLGYPSWCVMYVRFHACGACTLLRTYKER